jgi:hypothetical protein
MLSGYCYAETEGEYVLYRRLGKTSDNRVNVVISETPSINVIFDGFSPIYPLLKFTFEKKQFS